MVGSPPHVVLQLCFGKEGDPLGGKAEFGALDILLFLINP